jgi:lysophospholipase L1-like esterase
VITVAISFVALGDSTTCGLGDPLPDGSWRGFVPILAAALGPDTTYINLAVSGARTADVRHRQLPAALSARPDIASVIVGVNDAMRSDFDPDAIRDDALDTTRALAGAGAILLTVRLHDPGRVFGLPGVLARPLAHRIEQVNAVYDEAHERLGGVRVDLAGHPWTYRRESWSVDRMHPSEMGHRRLAHAYAEGLAAVGWPVAAMPSLECGGGVPPTVSADIHWMVTKGVPWVGRRARDLVPWAVTMVAREATRAASRRVRRRRRIAFPA